VTLSNIKIHCK